jgi:hypothetical protein
LRQSFGNSTRRRRSRLTGRGPQSTDRISAAEPARAKLPRWTTLPIAAILLTFLNESGLGDDRMLGAIGKAFSSPRAALLEVNPWLGADADEVARVFTLPNAVPDARVAVARRAATLARLRTGADAWNGWAATMQGLDGQLADDPAAQRLWAYLATTDFAGAAIEPSRGELAALVFPGLTDFTAARFADTASFSASIFAGEACFANAELAHGAHFEHCTFNGAARFDGVVFGRAGEFRRAEFLGPASFRAARFAKDAWFRGGYFAAALDMGGASFGGEAGLGDIRYDGPTSFANVRFGDNAGFEAAVFRDVVRFDDARFERNARFEQARFEREPTFDRARFLGRTFFQDIAVPEGSAHVQKAIAELKRRLG